MAPDPGAGLSRRDSRLIRCRQGDASPVFVGFHALSGLLLSRSFLAIPPPSGFRRLSLALVVRCPVAANDIEMAKALTVLL